MPKQTEWDGWLEVSKREPFRKHDFWFDIRVNASPEELTTRDQVRSDIVGNCANDFYSDSLLINYRILRRTHLVPRRLPLNRIHSEPVPLP